MPTQFKYGFVTKNVKWLLAFEMCANDRFEIEALDGELPKQRVV